MRRLTPLLAAGALAASTLVAPAIAVVPATPAHAEGGLTWPVGPSPSTEAELQPCASLLFVGVRGSGEPVPYGDTITRARNNIHDATSAARGTARELWVDYPASTPRTLTKLSIPDLLLSNELPANPYFDSARTGAKQLRAVLDDSATRCPQEKVVVAGFSQGAEIVTTALADLEPRNVIGVVVIGNPANSPALPGQRDGDSDPNALGLSSSLFYLRSAIAADRNNDKTNPIGAALQAALDLRVQNPRQNLATAAARAEGTEVPAAYGPVWESVCRKGDLICDAGSALSRLLSTQSTLDGEIDAATPLHRSYEEPRLKTATDAVAQRVVAQVRPLPTPLGPTAPRPFPWPWVTAGIGTATFLAGIVVGAVARGRRRGLRAGRPAPAFASSVDDPSTNAEA